MRLTKYRAYEALVALTFSTLVVNIEHVSGQGTAFTYEGRLNDNGSPASGSYDLQFYLRDAVTAGNPVGPANTLAPVVVSNGLFTVTLDFGAGIFTGPARWLEIGVRTNGSAGAYTILSPRQQLTPTPYAIYAGLSGNVTDAAISTSQLQTPGPPATGQVLAFNGSTLVWQTLSAAGGAWSLAGNTGTTTANFLGTIDNQPLEFKANNTRVLRFEPNAAGAPNIIGGASINFVAPGVTGSFIGGGGTANLGGFAYSNSVAANFGVIGGGYLNRIQTDSYGSTISGGAQNNIESNAGYSSIVGGAGNSIQDTSYYSTIGGGEENTIGSFAPESTIGGGGRNSIQGSGSTTFGTISGGFSNTIEANSYCCAVSGGKNNAIQANARFATIPGGSGNSVSGTGGFAAGQNAHANHAGGFVWGDGSTTSDSTGPNRFEILATGGVQLNDSTPGISFGHTTRQMLNLWNAEYGIGVQSNAQYYRTSGEFLWYKGGSHSDTFLDPGPGGNNLMRLGSTGNLIVAGTVTANGVLLISDRNVKEHFTAVDPQAVLEKVVGMPMSEWQFKTAPGERHLGPMAQDFHAAFGLGTDERHIAIGDEGGVALAAIKGLSEVLKEALKEKDAAIQSLKAQNTSLEKRLSELERAVIGLNRRTE